MRHIALSLFVVSVALVSCKPPPPAAPKLGWVKTEGMKAECYYPPDWTSFGANDRRIARADALKALESQWKGERNDGVSFDATVIENVDTALLGTPDAIENAAGHNAALCEKYMMGGSSSEWSEWLTGLPAQVNAGQCWHPLVDQIYYYLDINRAWQARAPVCKGDKVSVKGSEIDYYQLTPGGPWLNSAGDATKSAAGTSLPCNTEQCVYGELVVRFTGDSGAVVIWPAGLGNVITAPESGYLEVMVNDDEVSDNHYKVESGMSHHTSITYAPAP